MNSNETVFDYKIQRILVDLDYAAAPYLGDQLVGYYRLGLVRAYYPNSNITVKINKILSNFYFKEADQTLHDFKTLKYQNFDIIFRHTYNASAKRYFFLSYDRGLDYSLQIDPNDRDYNKDFLIHPDIFKYLPHLQLRNYMDLEQIVNELFLKKYEYKNIVYLGFREGFYFAKERNFNDKILEKVIVRLANKFKDTLFLMHTYKKKWAYFFYLNNIKNVFPFSQLTKDEINSLNLHKKAFFTGGKVKADLNLEIIYILIKQSNLFITSGNSGLGCFAQFIHPNMLCFVALREINWITKDNKYYKCCRKENYSDFTEEEIFEVCEQSIQNCNK